MAKAIPNHDGTLIVDTNFPAEYRVYESSSRSHQKT